MLSFIDSTICLIFLPDRNDENTCLNKIEARAVFSIPILKNLAERITNSSKKVYCDEAISIRQHGSATPLFPLPDGLGDISYAFELAHSLDKNIPVYA